MSGILVIAEHRMDELRPVSLELIAVAVGVKAQASGPVTVAIIANTKVCASSERAGCG